MDVWKINKPTLVGSVTGLVVGLVAITPGAGFVPIWSAVWNGLFFGDTNLLIAQIISILLTIVVAVIGTLICIGVVRLFTPLRVDKRDEQMGLDMSEHNETAYPSFNGLE